MEKTPTQLLDIALALRTSLRRAALLLVAIDGAWNGGRLAEPEDDESVRRACDSGDRGADRIRTVDALGVGTAAGPSHRAQRGSNGFMTENRAGRRTACVGRTLRAWRPGARGRRLSGPR